MSHFNNVESATSIVSCEWLQKHINDEHVRILDGSLHLPVTGRNAREEFAQRRIPGAQFFDINEHSAPSHLPHMLPDAEQFAMAAGALGISEQHTIVVYDAAGLFSAARLWWMFRHFGASHAVVLDGGLPAWERAGGALETASGDEEMASAFDLRHPPCTFHVGTTEQQRRNEVADADEVFKSIAGSDIVLDARSAGRFSAEEKEARAGLRSGHIPGSVNVPFPNVLNEQGLLKSADELRSLFAQLHIGPQSRTITTCGSGVTAAILCLALEKAGLPAARLYDGSWTEWGSLDHMPVATGTEDN